jgi:hypothetical protein
MPGVFKGFAVAMALLTATGAHAQDAAEAKVLAAWPKLAQRDGNQLTIMNHGGGSSANAADVLVDGKGGCLTYRFTGVLSLYDLHTRRLEPVAEVRCTTAGETSQILVGDPHREPLINSAGPLTASSDGHYVFVETVRRETPDGKPAGIGARILNWTDLLGDSDPFTVACAGSRPDGVDNFRATCTDPVTGHSFEARFAADPATTDASFKPWAYFNLSTPSDARGHETQDMIGIVANTPDPFNYAKAEAKALVAHPSLVRRDGPDLVVLDHGRDAGRISDDETVRCRYWFVGKTANLVDPRTGTQAPVAEIRCEHGEFDRFILAPAYGPPFVIREQYAVSGDGRTVFNGGDIVDWPSRKVLLSYGRPCYDIKTRGNDHFSATCWAPEDKSGATPELAIDFDRDAQGVWAITAHPATTK